GQDEFYFRLPHDQMDLCLFARNRGVGAAEVAQAAGLTTDQVGQAFQDIDTKRSSTRYQHLAPFLVDDIPGVGSSHGLRATKKGRPTSGRERGKCRRWA